MSAPRPLLRGAVAATVAVAAFVAALRHMLRHDYGADFAYPWLAARALLAGLNPYTVIGTPGWGDAPFAYPLPAALLALPLAPLPAPWATAVFVGLSGGLLAWGATRDGWHRMPLFLSFPFLYACTSGQWSPLMLAAAFLPWLQAVLPAKPPIGAVVWAYRPTWWAVAAGVAWVVASFAVLPTWPADWLAALARNPYADQYRVPALVPGGALLLLAALRWRTLEARVLLVVALVPQNLFAYEALVVFLVARTFGESLVLALGGAGVYVGLQFVEITAGVAGFAEPAGYLTLVCLYLPALLIVLRRPNEGPAPAWLERAVSRAPGWLRGRSADVAMT